MPVFFEDSWCSDAKEAVNDNSAVYEGFKDPVNFNHKMEFACLDKPEVRSHVTWEGAKVTYWGPPIHSDDEMSMIIKADLDTWKTVAAGDAEGGQLLMAGKIKFAKGPIAAAVENAGAFNNFLRSWGQVETDWNV